MPSPAVAPDLVLARFVAVPRSLAFRAWVEPERLARWWGPEGFARVRCEADAQPGGRLRIDLRAPDGTLRSWAGFFLESAPPERLAFTCRGLLPEVLYVATFAARGGGTEIAVQAHVVRRTPDEAADPDAMREEWTRNFARFAAHLETNP